MPLVRRPHTSEELCHGGGDDPHRPAHRARPRDPGGAESSGVNVAQAERWASLAGGGLLALGGMRRADLCGLAMAAVGGCLVYRGLTGHCQMYEALGVNTAERPLRARPASPPATASRSPRRSRSTGRPSELYRFWRNLENLPRFMRHLESVKVDGETLALGRAGARWA